MRLLLLTTALVSFILPQGQAEASSLPCQFYGGHIDMEGKIGSQRDIGEVSVFLPLGCKQDALLYTDLRFKRDNIDNMEGNFGLGIRQLYQEGIWGNYVYFDRKISGISDKYHSQLTFGSEWLAENWEVRANAYVPVTGEKSIASAPSFGGVSFSGNNIFLQETAGSRVTEEPLYGGDIEAGLKIPDTKFWLHAAGFTFAGNDVDDVTGGRIRTRYDLTEHVSLSAEGQYDDVRGRQGWLGVRFSIPFGGPAEKPEGLKARMTASPVRDVDIVTQSKKEKVGDDKLVPVLNAMTGTAQRILYVDNTAANGGDGSKDTPYNNLGSVQAQLQNNDIIYIYKGDGGPTGLNQGFNINRNNVQLIGSGTDFIYDGAAFTVNSSINPTGAVLIGKSAAPVIANANAWQNTININGMNTTIAGVNIDGGQYTGLSASANGVNYGNLFLRDVSVSNNSGLGVFITTQNGGEFKDIRFENVTTNGNDGYGVRIDSNSKIGSITAHKLTTSNNIGPAGMGLFINASDGTIGDIRLNDITAEGNSRHAIMIGASGSVTTTIASTVIDGAKVTSNGGSGFFITAGSLGALSNVRINNARSEGNNEHGYFLETYGGGSFAITMQNSTVTQNQLHGIRVNKDWADLSTVDFGGGGSSAGGNRLFNNGLSNPGAYYDINHGFGGEIINAQNNWWGQGGGPVSGQLNDPAYFDVGGALSTDPGL